MTILNNDICLNLGDREIKVIETPGHTPGGVSFIDKTYGLLFTGDLLYEGPLYAFENESNPEIYLNSLKEIAKLPIKTIHPGHNHPNNNNYPNLLNEATNLFERVIKDDRYDKKSDELQDVVEYLHPNYNAESGKGRKLRVLVKLSHSN